MITCHDIGQHLGCYGVEEVHTPNIDLLASKGIMFENVYSTSGVCTPGRGSLLTGRYPQSNGLMGLTHAPWWWKLNEGERHIASLLKDAGYRTTLIGLQHVTHGPVEELGYQQHLSTKSDAEETVAQATQLIRNAASGDQPFFVKVGFKEVHRPFTHGKDSANGIFVPPYLQNTQAIRDDLADLQATIRYFDESVGKILDALYQSNITDQTLVIFTAEHGIPYPGAKWSVRKAGIEIPLIMYQPASIFEGGRKYEEVISNVDILPTVFEHLDVAIPQNIEGLSFYSFLSGSTEEAPRTAAFAQYTPDMKRDNLSRSVITERYHLIRYFDQGRSVVYPTDANPVNFARHIERCKTSGTRPFFQLYDIQKDPHELNDLSDDLKLKGVAAQLQNQLLNWMEKVNDPLLQGPLETPYYDKSMEDLRNYR
jgi:arylsulfatase A-like enzyme